MKKTKKQLKKVSLKNAKGVFYKDILWYYDNSADFLEAWPGIKMMIEVESGVAHE